MLFSASCRKPHSTDTARNAWKSLWRDHRSQLSDVFTCLCELLHVSSEATAAFSSKHSSGSPKSSSSQHSRLQLPAAKRSVLNSTAWLLISTGLVAIPPPGSYRQLICMLCTVDLSRPNKKLGASMYLSWRKRDWTRAQAIHLILQEGTQLKPLLMHLLGRGCVS